MHHGTCIAENVSDTPGACATRNFHIWQETHTMAADDMTTQGTRTSAVRIMTLFIRKYFVTNTRRVTSEYFACKSRTPSIQYNRHEVTHHASICHYVATRLSFNEYQSIIWFRENTESDLVVIDDASWSNIAKWLWCMELKGAEGVAYIFHNGYYVMGITSR